MALDTTIASRTPTSHDWVHPTNVADPQADFNQHLPAIQAYKTQHGVTWEQAYHMVTGHAWPGSKDVNINTAPNGQQSGEMVDEGPGALGTIGHILKVAAPVAATIMSGGALSPLAAAAMGAGGAAAGGAMSGDHGWGLVGDAALGAAPVGAKALTAAATGGGMAAQGMHVGADGAMTPFTQGGASAGGSMMSRLLGSQTPGGGGSPIQDLSRAFGAYGQAEANNRGAANDDTSRYNQVQINAQTGRDQDETNSMNKLAQTSYIMNGGSQYKPGNLTLNGHTYALDDHGTGPTPVSDIYKQGAGNLQAQLLQRLQPGGTVTPTLPQTKPGTGENIANAGSLMSSGVGFAHQMGWL